MNLKGCLSCPRRNRSNHIPGYIYAINDAAAHGDDERLHAGHELLAFTDQMVKGFLVAPATFQAETIGREQPEKHSHRHLSRPFNSYSHQTVVDSHECKQNMA